MEKFLAKIQLKHYGIVAAVLSALGMEKNIPLGFRKKETLRLVYFVCITIKLDLSL